tara:strand:+ start:1018 stop:1314 length:297 start_codon:yes stop_codon:yes gene_type:complete
MKINFDNLPSDIKSIIFNTSNFNEERKLFMNEKRKYKSIFNDCMNELHNLSVWVDTDEDGSINDTGYKYDRGAKYYLDYLGCFLSHRSDPFLTDSDEE